MVKAIHQFVASFRPRDAIGLHALEVRRTLRGQGYDSDIFAWDAPEARAYAIRDFRRFGRRGHQRDTVLVYQLSTGGVIGDFVIGRSEPVVVNYHNVTPERFLTPWHKDFGKELRQGRQQLRTLSTSAVLGLAVSHFNEQELREAGYRQTRVAPVLIDPAALAEAEDKDETDRLRSATARGVAWLFVGRLVPNKCQHDLIKAFAAYRRVFDGQGRLRLVGTPADGSYERSLHQLADALGISDSVDFVGSVSPAALSAHYAAADVFVCVSEHEGFNVPVVEAMHRALPVIGFSAAAIPETVGNGGLILRSKAALDVAAAVHAVTSETCVARALSEAGRKRAKDFELDRSRAAFLEALAVALDHLT